MLLSHFNFEGYSFEHVLSKGSYHKLYGFLISFIFRACIIGLSLSLFASASWNRALVKYFVQVQLQQYLFSFRSETKRVDSYVKRATVLICCFHSTIGALLSFLKSEPVMTQLELSNWMVDASGN